MPKFSHRRNDLQVSVLNTIWDLTRITNCMSVGTVLTHMKGEFAYTTIKTVMDRLRDCGYLTAQKIGKKWYYTPELTREKAVEQVINELIQDYFNGDRSKLKEMIGV